ncbi:MAG: SDR family oxidoreductase [Phycisphaeraceae bacterium]
MELKDKVALVTGGTRGIGAATALLLAQQGADVAIVGRNRDDEALATQQSVQEAGRRCELIIADMAQPEQATTSVQQTVKTLGALDVLVHSAGGLTAGTIFDVTPQDWMTAFAVHVHAVYHLSRAAIPLMRQRGGGAIVLISSVAGLRGCPNSVCYQVVKGALPQFARALSRDHANDNIRVNAVAPGIIRTRFHEKMPPAVKQNNLDNRIPLHREGTPEQVASLVCELIRNDYITGETVTIDGGLTMRIA